MQISNFGNVLRKLVYLKCITDRGLGAKPPAAGGFEGLGAKPPAVGQYFVIFWKKSYFNAIGSHSQVFRAIWKH